MRLHWNQIVSNAVTVLVAAVFVGAATQLWHGVSTIDSRIDSNLSHIRATQEVLSPKVDKIEKKLVEILKHVEAHDKIKFELPEKGSSDLIDEKRIYYGTLSKKLYCKLNGYDFIVGDEIDYAKIEDAGEDYGWLKVYKLLECYFDYDYIFISDGDVSVMNFETKLEDIADQYFDDETFMLITKDQHDFNSGNILIKGKNQKFYDYICKWKELLRTPFDEVAYYEQPSLIHMIRHTDFGSVVKTIDQSIMNSYCPHANHSFSAEHTEGTGCAKTYEEGDFLIHYAAQGNRPRGESLSEDLMKERLIKALELYSPRSTPAQMRATRQKIQKLLRCN